MNEQTIIERARMNFRKCVGMSFAEMLDAEQEDRRMSWQRPALAVEQPPAPVDDVVAREGCYTKEQIEKVLRGVFVSGRFDELTWTNETVDELMPMVLARLVARDECWRGALAAKDQTIALLREHLALAKGEAQK